MTLFHRERPLAYTQNRRLSRVDSGVEANLPKSPVSRARRRALRVIHAFAGSVRFGRSFMKPSPARSAGSNRKIGDRQSERELLRTTGGERHDTVFQSRARLRRNPPARDRPTIPVLEALRSRFLFLGRGRPWSGRKAVSDNTARR